MVPRAAASRGSCPAACSGRATTHRGQLGLLDGYAAASACGQCDGAT